MRLPATSPSWALFSRRPLRLVVVLAAGLVFGGCRVDSTIEARVSGAGGTVTARFVLDREAVALLGGAVGDGAQTSDLGEAGWEITPVRRTDDGGAEVELSKEFHRPGDLGRVIAELAGPAGPLRDFRLDRRRSFARAAYRLSGTADVGAASAAVTGFANTPDLAARLRDAGVDPARVEELLAARAAEGFRLRLVVNLPGRTESFDVRAGAPQTIEVASSVRDPTRPVLLVVALVTGLVVLVRLRRRPPRN